MQNPVKRRSYRFLLILSLVVFSSLVYLSVGSSSQAKLAQSSKNAHARPAVVLTSNTTASSRVTQPGAKDVYGKLPLSFVPNRGQTDSRAQFLARGSGYNLFLTSEGAVVALHKRESVRGEKTAGRPASSPGAVTVLRMKLLDADPAVQGEGIEELPGRTNYFFGSDPGKWQSNVPNYRRVRYQSIYPGVNLEYYGNQSQLEYDFVIAPGADPSIIKLSFEDAPKVAIDAQGDLVVYTAGGKVRQSRPLIYQMLNGVKKEVSGRYILKGKREVGFAVGSYDASVPLVIDPVLSYSSYLGGNNDDVSYDIVVDSAGNAYLTGDTFSTNFPGTSTPVYVFHEAFVTKLNPTGSGFVYSTYLGGSNNEIGYKIAVDSAGNAYVVGTTDSNNFPVTPGCFQPLPQGGIDAFVTKFNSTGSIVYSTYLGGNGNDFGRGIFVDSAGNAYIAGATSSTTFPVIAGSFQTLQAGLGDAFVTKLNAAGSGLVYSTYLGGTDIDEGQAVAVDVFGNAYVTGFTRSHSFPKTSGAFQGSLASDSDDVFVTKLNPSGSALVYSTFLGGVNDDAGFDLALDSSGNAYVTGDTRSPNFPVTPGAFQTSYISRDAFVTKLNATGAGLMYSSYLAGNGEEAGRAIAVDASGNAYVAGSTSSTNFSQVHQMPQPNADFGNGFDAFAVKLNVSGSRAFYSNYIGGNGTEFTRGLAIDAAGNAFITGSTDSINFPTNNPFQSANADGGGFTEGFVTKLAPVLYNISGQVTQSGGAGVAGVTMILTGSKYGIVLTNGNGDYTLTGIEEGGSYLLTPSSAGLAFTPANVAFNDLSGNQTANFTAATAVFEPVVLTASQVEIKTWTFQGTTYAYLKLSFPNAGYRVANWGSAVRSGNDFTADASVERFTGPSVQAVTTTAQIYDLGALTPGNYNFTFKNSGTTVKTIAFAVAAPPFPPNPIDDAREFVKQQYRDFLNREADTAGENFWTGNITKCSDPAQRPPGQTEAQCTLRQRETTSGAFFLSPEFQYTGYFVYRMYQGALGRQPKLSEFLPDAQFVGNGIVVNGQLSAARINQNKSDFAQQFVNCVDSTKYRCSEFKAIYDGLTNQQYVDKLFQTTGVNASAPDRAALVNGLNASTETRASVLQKVVDGIVVIAEGNQTFTTSYGQAFYNSEFNRAFVLLEYVGYMKRDPDDAGYAFWLAKLNQFGGNFVNAEMVLAFISSPEYRARFGQP